MHLYRGRETLGPTRQRAVPEAEPVLGTARLLRVLAQRAGDAAGPDVTLDSAVTQALLPRHWNGVSVKRWFADGDLTWGCDTADGFQHWGCVTQLPFTSSLDAVTTALMPAGQAWQCGTDPGRGGFARSPAGIRYAATPVLALLASILECLADAAM